MGRNEALRFGDSLRRGIKEVARRMLLKLIALVVPGMLVFFRFKGADGTGSTVLLYFAAIIAVPLLLYTLQDYVGREPAYFSSLVLRMAVDLLFEPATAFNFLLIGACRCCPDARFDCS